MKVYICGSKNDRKKFREAEKELKEKGHSPINPIKIIRALPEEVNNADFTVIAFEIIRICDAVYLLDGWDKDLFARLEKAHADRTRKEIMQ